MLGKIGKNLNLVIYIRSSKELSITPYEKHLRLGHKVVRYSPNGIDLIEECKECVYRFLHTPGRDYPVKLRIRVEDS